MTVEKYKPRFTPHRTEERLLDNQEISEKLIAEAKQSVTKTRLLLHNSRGLVEASKAARRGRRKAS